MNQPPPPLSIPMPVSRAMPFYPNGNYPPVSMPVPNHNASLGMPMPQSNVSMPQPIMPGLPYGASAYNNHHANVGGPPPYMPPPSVHLYNAPAAPMYSGPPPYTAPPPPTPYSMNPTMQYATQPSYPQQEVKKSKLKQAMKYGLPIAGAGLGVYALSQAFHHHHSSSSSSSSDSD